MALLKYSVRINGVDDLAITKLDVLDVLDEINVCVGYRHNGSIIDNPPQSSQTLYELEPVYQSLPAWEKPVKGMRNYDELDPQAKKYLKFIEDFVGVKISIISTGAEREDTIVLS